MKKYEDIYNYLKQIIDGLKPGELVPSVRAIMDDCSVSQITVTNAMACLKKEGVIVSRIGEGTFKAGAAASSAQNYRLAMFVPDFPSQFSSSLQGKFKTFFSMANYDFRVFCYDYHMPRLKKSMIKGNIDGIIVFAGTNFEVETVAALRQLGLPAVIINLIPGGLPLDAVCTDNEFGGAMAADWFFTNGHRRMAMLLSQPHGPTLDQRRLGFERRLRLANLDSIKIIDCQTENGADSTASAYHRFHALYRAGEIDFTAIFCDSDLGAFGIMKACNELGINIPNQLSVIGFDNLPEDSYFCPSLTSVDQNIAAWAVETDKILKHRLHNGGGPAIQTQVRPTLHIRNSIRIIS